MPTIAKQIRILAFIKRYAASNHEAPTMAEIGRQFGMTSSGSVHANLKKMEGHGWIKRSRRHRGIEIVEQERKSAA